jgi:hypothetical protein
MNQFGHTKLNAVPGMALTLRALFLGALIVIVARVSSLQSETIWGCT